MDILTSLISAIIGGIVATILKAYFDKKKEVDISLMRLTEEKYRSLLIFMACALDIDKKRYFALNEQVSNETAEDYMNQIKEYYYHSLLYSSDEVISSLKSFIVNPTKETYIKVAQTMRKELWGKNTNLALADLTLL